MYTCQFVVSDGVYPFDNILGLVEVPMHHDPEVVAASALREAIRIYGGHPTVSV